MTSDPKLLPSNEEAEQALLGAVLLDNRALDDIGFLSSDDFFIPAHGRILAAARWLRRSGQRADPITLKTYFERDGDLDGVGGTRYLVDLMGSIVSVHNAADYGRAIADASQRRRLLSMAQTLLVRAVDAENVEEAMAGAKATLDAIDERQAATDPQEVSLHDVAVRVAEDAERMANGAVPRLVRTGIRALDDALGGGLWPGDLTLLAGRPSMGKTTLAECIANNIANAGGRVLVISPEMPAEQLARKDLLRRTAIPVSVQLAGPITLSEAVRLKNAARLVHKNVIVNDRSRPKPSQVERQARGLMRNGPLDLIIIDQAPLMASDRESSRRYELLTDVFTDTASVARSLKVPVLLLHQLSRSNETRDNKTPTLADLRDTGAAEERARVVMFVHRPEYYTQREGPKGNDAAAEAAFAAKLNEEAGKAQVIIAKHHLAKAPQTVHLEFDAALQSFRDKPMTLWGSH